MTGEVALQFVIAMAILLLVIRYFKVILAFVLVTLGAATLVTMYTVWEQLNSL